MPALAFDLGGTFLRCGVAGDGGELAAPRKRRIRSIDTGCAAGDAWNEIVEAMASYCQEVADLVNRDTPIVIAFPGPVRDERVPLIAPTVTGAAAPPDLAAQLHRATGREVRMLNDVSAAAWYFSQRIDAATFMVVTVSSGIGSKIFHTAGRGHAFDGVPHGGEIGHLVVDASENAPRCDCGGLGHLGAVASGRGTQMLARQLAAADVAFTESRCARVYGAVPQDLDNEHHLVPAARDGDAWSWHVIRTALEPLAQVLAVAAHAAGLERIVLIGGFATRLGEPYRRALAEAMRAHCDGGPLSIRPHELLVLWDASDEPCLRGAGAYAQARGLAAH